MPIDNNILVTSQEAERMMIIDTSLPDYKCITYGDLKENIQNQTLLINGPEGHYSTDVSVLYTDDTGAITIRDTVAKARTAISSDSKIIFYKCPTLVNVRYETDGQPFSETHIRNVPIGGQRQCTSFFYNPYLSALHQIFDSSSYDNSVGLVFMKRSTIPGPQFIPFATFEFMGKRVPDIAATGTFYLRKGSSSVSNLSKVYLNNFSMSNAGGESGIGGNSGEIDLTSTSYTSKSFNNITIAGNSLPFTINSVTIGLRSLFGLTWRTDWTIDNLYVTINNGVRTTLLRNQRNTSYAYAPTFTTSQHPTINAGDTVNFEIYVTINSDRSMN